MSSRLARNFFYLFTNLRIASSLAEIGRPFRSSVIVSPTPTNKLEKFKTRYRMRGLYTKVQRLPFHLHVELCRRGKDMEDASGSFKLAFLFLLFKDRQFSIFILLSFRFHYLCRKRTITIPVCIKRLSRGFGIFPHILLFILLCHILSYYFCPFDSVLASATGSASFLVVSLQSHSLLPTIG